MAVFKNISDELIWEQYRKDNYLVEVDETTVDDRCCIYFSGNGLCFPETEQNFVQTIVQNNSYEWYKRRIEGVKKSIFVRDILKNFYVLGISERHNTLDKLCGLLKQESKGYRIITVGSSAGGYAAAICGLLLMAETVFDFSGQISLWNYFDFRNKKFLQKYRGDEKYCRYYDLYPFLQKNSSTVIVYVWAALSKEDKTQFDIIKDLDNKYFKPIAIRVHRHGMPIFPECLPYFFDIGNIRQYEFLGGGDIPFSFYNAVWRHRHLFMGND